MKPSHVRKRNFGATFADAVDKANADRLSDINDLGQTRGEEAKGERPRSGVSRTRGGAEAGHEREWERLLQRASVIKPRFKPPPAAGSAAVNAAVTAAAGLNATEQQQPPRGRIRLKGSFLGIYAKGNTTPRSPRTDDDVPQRPDKRERIRNLRIRRPFISDSGKTSTTTTKSTTTSTASSKSPRATSTAFTTAAPSSHEHSSLSSSPLTSSEKIINLKGIVKEYKEIVRTSSTSTTTASTAAVESSPSEAKSSIATTKRVATTATTTTQEDIATASTTTTTSAAVSETLPNVESSENAVISSESESVSDRASTSSEPPSIQSAAPSSLASLAVTESKELPGSSDMKQSKTHNKSLSQSASSQLPRDDITTRNPIEIQRPREELQKDLLEAIRRKISRNKQQLAAVGATQISVNQAETEAGGRIAQQSNFISSSTKNPPLFFRPGLSFPGSPAKKNSSTDPRIKIFVNLPPGSSKYQDPTSVKIPNISHIRSKIERLNDAINTGLKLERIREKEALENDWRQSGVQKTVVRSQSSSVQIVSQKSHQDSVHNDQGNQETIRKQSLAPPSSKSGIKNQFESSTTTVGTTTTAQAQTTTTATTSTASTTMSDRKEEVGKEKLLHEHPSSHFRPANWTRTRDFIPMPKSNLPPKEDVQLFVVTPKHVASYKPVTQTPGSNKHQDDDEYDDVNVVVGDQEPVKAAKDAEDITNTTIIVIAVISVIPVAGLVAWGVRTVLRRKVTVICLNLLNFNSLAFSGMLRMK